MPRFNVNDKFNKEKAFSRVKFGRDATLLDVELNEMQKISQYKSEQVIRTILTDGFLNRATMTLSAGTITVPVDTVFVEGKIVEILEPMTLAGLTTGDKVYLAVWEDEVAHNTSIKRGGNQSGGTTISNADIIDSELGEESSRRVQIMSQLTKNNADSTKTHLLLATLTSASAFTDNRVKVNANIDILPSRVLQDAGNRFFTDTERTKLAGISANANNYTHPATHPPSIIVQDASNRFFTDAERTKLGTIEANANNYTHPANHPPSIITQDMNNRFVTDAEKASWNAKETVAGATAKANTAETNAKAYTDTKVSDLVASAPATLDTLKELSDALGNDANFATTITNLVATKETPAGAQAKVDAHSSDNVRHITSSERTTWNAKASTAVVTTSSNGLMISTDKSKLDGISAGANNYTHPSTHPPSIIVQDASNRFVTDAEKTSWTAKETPEGAQTKADDKFLAKTASTTIDWNTLIDPGVSNTLLMGTAPNGPGGGHHYYVLVVKYSSNVSQVAIPYSTVGTIFTRSLFNGTWTSWTDYETPTGAQAKVNTHAGDSVAHITSSERTSWNAKASTAVATTSANGLMSSTDKTKLDGVSAGANNYTHPSTHPPSIIVQDASNRFVTDTEKANWNGKESTTGAQSKSDTAQTNAQNYALNLNTVNIMDTRTVNSPPSFYRTGGRMWFEFKTLAILAISATGTYCTLMTDGRYPDASGGQVTQIAFTDTNRTFTRTSTSETVWGAWTELATTATASSSNNGLMSSTDKSKLDGANFVSSATANGILRLDASAKLPASITGNADGNSATATRLATAHTISLTGDVTGSVSFDGSGNASIATTFKNSGVTAGTYGKVTVDAKGNVTAGTSLIASDIPSLDWSKITSGKPTTLAGYGIVDAVPMSTISATLPATAGWYRIATSPVGILRCAGRFEVDWAGSSSHGQVNLHAGIMYGVDPTINQLMFSSFNMTNGITQARIVYHTTASGNYAYLEVFNATALALPITVVLASALGWSLITPVAGSIPSGYSTATIPFSDGLVTDTQLVSTIGTGTAPLKVSSSTLVPTLNVDLLDGYHANTGTTANTIPVRDASGNLPGNILGNSATATRLATARTISLTGVVTGSTTFDGSGNATIATSVANATTGANGLMSSADKSKLDGVATGATNTVNHATNGVITVNGVAQTVYTHPTGAGNNHIPTGGATGDFLKYSASGTAVWSGVAGTDVTQATTAVRGTVQLSDAVNSTSTTLAGTANAVKQAYDRAEQAFQSASDGKTAIANAVKAQGVSASSADTFSTLATKIGQLGNVKKVTLTKTSSSTKTSRTDEWGYSVNASWITFTSAEIGFAPARILITKASNTQEAINATVFTGSKYANHYDNNDVFYGNMSYSTPFTGTVAGSYLLPVMDTSTSYTIECYSS